MQVNVILFDWGGTLAHVVRQVENLRRGAVEVARMVTGLKDAESLDRLIDEVISAEARAARDPEFREVDVHDLLATWVASNGRPIDGGRLTKAAESLGRSWIGSLDPIPGAVDTLRTLHARGYRMGLVSNCLIPPAQCLEELTRQRFRDLLDFAVFSSEVRYRKPSPIIYERALNLAFPDGRPPDLSHVLFVGDSPLFDVIIPSEMGMRTALVADHARIWPAEDGAAARPDFRIDSVAELPYLLNRR